MAAELPLSVLLLVRDETADVEALLPALAFARERVVVWDPRGEHATRDAAVRLGASVHERSFDGFGPQRRFALSRCTQPWVLWIDADERLRDGAAAEIAAAIAGDAPDAAPDAAPDGYLLGRETRFLGRRIRFCGWQRERVLRLFRRDRWEFDDAPVHEELFPAAGAAGRTVELATTLDHDSYATIEACETKMRRYAEAGAEKAFRAGKRAGFLDVTVRPPLRFLRQYVLQLGFLDGAHGFLLCRYAARQVALKYTLLRERSRAGVRP